MGEPHKILNETLLYAVPLWIDRLASVEPGRRAEVAKQWTADAADAADCHADAILYGGGPVGDLASAFNALARGIAALASDPGGITFRGVTWCMAHHPIGVSPPAPAVTDCPDCPTDGILATITNPALSNRYARNALLQLDQGARRRG